MAASCCAKCDGRSFELKENKVAGAEFKLMFVQCSGCGAVVGVTDYYNVPSLVEALAQKLGTTVLP